MQGRSPGMLDLLRLSTDFRPYFTEPVRHHDEVGTVARVSRHDEALAVTLHVIAAVDNLLCCSGPTRLQVMSESWSCSDTQINSVRAKSPLFET